MQLQRGDFNKNFGLEFVHYYPSLILLKDFSQGAPSSIKDKILAHFLCCLFSLLEKKSLSFKHNRLFFKSHPVSTLSLGILSPQTPLSVRCAK
jgi:hypothetical protein